MTCLPHVGYQKIGRFNTNSDLVVKFLSIMMKLFAIYEMREIVKVEFFQKLTGPYPGSTYGVADHYSKTKFENLVRNFFKNFGQFLRILEKISVF